MFLSIGALFILLAEVNGYLHCIKSINLLSIKENYLFGITSTSLATANFDSTNEPISLTEYQRFDSKKKYSQLLAISIVSFFQTIHKSKADDLSETTFPLVATVGDIGELKLPYNHVNIPFKTFMGKATIVFNMKIDDPQTISQFPQLLEIYQKYSKDGLAVHAFPTEQGWFEPDDDETCRIKAKEYYGFGEIYPSSIVFDKIDLLGPSAHPLYATLTQRLPTPNGYTRITLNYEKFLLNSKGEPVRRYPRKYSAYDMEGDIQALLQNQPLPPESPAFQKAWREAKREVEKSEYAFRFNYNYYDSPDSMYKYNPKNDLQTDIEKT